MKSLILFIAVFNILFHVGAVKGAASTTASTTSMSVQPNIPLKFFDGYKSYSGRYFATESLSQGVEYTTELEEAHEIKYLNATTMAEAHPPVVLHVEKLSKDFDYILLEDSYHLHARCSSFSDFNEGFANATCRAVGKCNWEFHGSTPATHVTELIIKGGPNVSSKEPTCVKEKPVFSGWLLVSEGRKFISTPTYHYGFLMDGHHDTALALTEAKHAWGDHATQGSLVLGRPVDSNFSFYPGGHLHLARLKVGAHANISKPLHTSTTAMKMTVCDVFDTSSMNMYNGIGKGHSLECGECTSVFDLYEECQKDETCIGYSTVIEDDHGHKKEAPLYLHYGTSGYTANATYHNMPAMYYEKQPESARTCKLETDVGGTLDIYLLQTFFEEGTASVYVGKEFIRECGKSSKFIGDGKHVHGHSHSCNTYVLCHSMEVWSHEIIKVISSEHMRQGGCKESMSVIFNISDVHSVHHTPEPVVSSTPAPIDTHEFEAHRPLLYMASEKPVATIKLFAQHISKLALQTYQTGFDCYNRTCPEHMIEIDVKDHGKLVPVQKCGGTKGFYEGAGKSDQCHTHVHCEAPTALTDYSGFVTLKLKMGSMQYRSHNCRKFSGEMEAAVSPEAKLLRLDPFLLVDHDGFLASPLFIFPKKVLTTTTTTTTTSTTSTGGHRRAGTAENKVAAVATTHFAHAPVHLKTLEIGSYEHPYEGYYVDYNHHVPTPAELSPNVSFACIIDHIGVSHVRCVITIPAAATHMKIEVAQTDFASNEFHFEVERHGQPGTTHLAGGSAYGFLGLKGRSNLCHTYLTAADEFLYSTQNPVNKWEKLSLSIPVDVHANECNVSFAALVHFDDRPIPDLSHCAEHGGFVCSSEMTCLHHDEVCDGIVDCSNMADEKPCSNWRLVEDGKRFELLGFESHHPHTDNLAECKRIAVFNGTNAFAYDEHHEDCIIYVKSQVNRALKAPSKYLKVEAGTQLFVHLEGDITEYNKCSEALHCNSRGTLHHADKLKDGDVCECTCHHQYTEHDCSLLKRLQSLRELVAVFPKADEEDMSPSPSGMANAILGSRHDVRIEPGNFEYFNSTHEALGFQLESIFEAGAAESYAGTLFGKNILHDINIRLEEAVQPTISFFTSRTSMALFETLPGCDETGTSTGYYCHLATAQAAHRRRAGGAAAPATTTHTTTVVEEKKSYAIDTTFIREMRVTGISIESMTVELTPVATSARRAATGAKNVTCNSSNTAHTKIGKCEISTCVFPVHMHLAEVKVTAITKTSSCKKKTGITVEGQHEVPLPPAESHEPLLIHDPREIAQLVVPIVVIALCLGMVIYGYVRIKKHTAYVEEQATEKHGSLIDHEEETGPGVNIILNYVEKSIITEEYEGVDPRRRSICCMFLALLLTFFMIFTIVLYVKAIDRESNYTVLVEHYRDELAAESPLSFLPFRVSLVHPFREGCQRLSAEGEATANIAMRAECRHGPNDTHLVYVSAARDQTHCEHMEPIYISTEKCVKLEDYFGSSLAGLGYTCFHCLTHSDGLHRFEIFVNMTEESEEAAHVIAGHPTEHLKPYKSNATGFSVYPFVHHGRLYHSTSTHPNRISSTARAEDFHGAVDSRRIIMHVGKEWLEPEPIPAVNSTTTKLEKENLEHLDGLPKKITDLSPDHSDYPVGEIFNNWGIEDEHSGAAAGADAQRYYYMKKTAFDIGSYFGPEPAHDVAGEGVTIQAWVRASETTNGFIYALVDGYENSKTGGNIIIDHALELLAAGHGSWFKSQWSLYYGLYINGGDRSLHFVYASPVDDVTKSQNGTQSANETVELAGPPFVDLKWDMTELGMTRLFNEMWHRVDVVIRFEQDRTNVLLFVDGETSLSTKGWTQCAPRRPSRIHTPHSAHIEDVVADSLVMDGIMYVGYVNGGVHGVEVEKHAMVKDESTLKATIGIFEHNKIDEVGYTTLGGVLLSLGCLGVLYTISLARKGISGAKSEAEETEQKALVLYQAMMLVPVKHGNDQYAVPKFSQVRKWLDLEGQEDLLIKVLEEIYSNTKGAKYEVELICSLWRATHPSEEKEPKDGMAKFAQSTLPDVVAWNKFVFKAWLDEKADPPVWRDDDPPVDEEKKADEKAEEDADEEDPEPKVICVGTSYAANAVAIIVLTNAMQRQKALVCVEDGNLGFQAKVLKKKIATEGGEEGEEVEGEGDEDTAQGTMEEGAGGAAMDQNMVDGNMFDLGMANAVLPIVTGTGSTGSTGNPFGEIIAILMHVIQTIAMYTAAISFPAVYLGSFGVAFNFFALDFAQAFPDIDTMATPILQFVIGVIVFYALVYAAVMDNKVFMENAVEYAQRRDEKEIANSRDPMDVDAAGCVKQRAEAFPLEPEPKCPYVYDVQLMHAHARGILDQAADTTRDDNEWKEGEQVDIEDEGSFEKLGDEGKFKAKGSDKEELETVGAYCRHHPEEILTATFQNTVSPYQNQRKCCVVENGVRCNESNGLLYHCNYACPVCDGSDEEYTCDFAVCAAHFRPSLVETLKTSAISTVRDLKEKGPALLFIAMIIAVTGILYMPFVKTACMIIICHPFYQCEFEHCWENPDSKFAVAAFMAIFFVAIFGVGIPLAETIALTTRYKWLRKIFAAPMYRGRYQEAPEPEDQQEEDKDKKASGRSSSSKKSSARKKDKGAASDLSANAPVATAIDADAPVTAGEWSRFLTTDSSQLAEMYNSFTLPWMFLAPIYLLFKLILLIPAVFLEPESFPQLVGVGIAEGLYWIFVFVTAPYVSLVTDATAKIGSCHQLLLIGFQSLHTVEVFRGNKEGYKDWMVATTSCFVIFVFIELFFLKIWNIIQEKRKLKRLKATLEGLGIRPAKCATLYLAQKDAVKKRDVEETRITVLKRITPVE